MTHGAGLLACLLGHLKRAIADPNVFSQFRLSLFIVAAANAAPFFCLFVSTRWIL
jgi:hypothetical protein